MLIVATVRQIRRRVIRYTANEGFEGRGGRGGGGRDMKSAYTGRFVVSDIPTTLADRFIVDFTEHTHPKYWLITYAVQT